MPFVSLGRSKLAFVLGTSLLAACRAASIPEATITKDPSTISQGSPSTMGAGGAGGAGDGGSSASSVSSSGGSTNEAAADEDDCGCRVPGSTGDASASRVMAIGVVGILGASRRRKRRRSVPRG
jgi:hypothetical protein